MDSSLSIPQVPTDANASMVGTLPFGPGHPRDTKGIELLKRIQQLARLGTANDPELASIKREAQDLLSSDPGYANEVLGLVSVWAYDACEAQRAFRRAIEIRKNDALLMVNYSVALVRLGRLDEAVEAIESARNISPEKPQVLNMAIHWNTLSGRLSSAAALCDAWSELHREQVHEWRAALRWGEGYLKQRGIRESDVRELIGSAVTVLRESKTGIVGFNYRNLYDEDSEWMSFHLLLAKSVDEVVNLNVRLAEKLASMEFPLKAKESVNVMFLVYG